MLGFVMGGAEHKQACWRAAAAPWLAAQPQGLPAMTHFPPLGQPHTLPQPTSHFTPYALPDESALGRLDSSVKKNGTFIKKLRQLGADNRQQLLAEAAKLNLSKVCMGVFVGREGGCG